MNISVTCQYILHLTHIQEIKEMQIRKIIYLNQGFVGSSFEECDLNLASHSEY